MINRAVFNLSLTEIEINQLEEIKPWEGNHWDDPPNQDIKAIKTKIRQQLEAAQSVCSYCGLKLGGTSKGEIDHIAPKNQNKHPEFTFTLQNLTLACHNCNFSGKKGQKETLSRKINIYIGCEFLLVHPYLDDPNQHYEWTDNEIELLIQVRNNSPKALFSIKMFGLDEPRMNELRAQQVRFEERKIARPLSNQDQQLLDTALNYKAK